MKPYFLPAALAVEVWLGARRGPKVWARPQAIGLVATWFAYALLLLVWTPEYLDLAVRIAPIYPHHDPIGPRLIASSWRLALVATAVGVGWFGARRRAPGWIEVCGLLAVWLTAAVYLTGKGWDYHWYPAETLSILLLATGGAGLIRARPATAGSLVAVTGLVALCAAGSLVDRLGAGRVEHPIRRVVRDRAAGGGTLLVLSPWLHKAFPMVLEADARWGMRHPMLWQVAAFYRGGTWSEGRYHALTAMDGPERRFVAEVADAAHVVDLRAYQAFTCLAPGAREAGADTRLDRAADGKLIYAWKADTAELGYDTQQALIAAGKMKPEEVLMPLRDVETDAPIHSHGGSVFWNPYRKRWIMISGQAGGASSYLGELWFAEADTPVGPWVYARKIVTHDHYTFYNPTQHPFLDGDAGRLIYLEGTYTDTYSGNPDLTPRYNYNQIMYRLALDDPRLSLPVPVYTLAGPEGNGLRETIDARHAWGLVRDVAFFAVPPGRAHGDLMPIRAAGAAGGPALFYALPPVPTAGEKASPPSCPCTNTGMRRLFGTRRGRTCLPRGAPPCRSAASGAARPPFWLWMRRPSLPLKRSVPPPAGLPRRPAAGLPVPPPSASSTSAPVRQGLEDAVERLPFLGQGILDVRRHDAEDGPCHHAFFLQRPQALTQRGRVQPDLAGDLVEPLFMTQERPDDVQRPPLAQKVEGGVGGAEYLRVVRVVLHDCLLIGVTPAGKNMPARGTNLFRMPLGRM